MRPSGRRSGGLDPERLVVAAVEAYLDGRSAAPGEHADEQRSRRRLGGGSVAIGVVIALGARTLYRRARDFDLERAARAVERRIVD